MILFFYNLALLAALVLSAPWWLFRMATTRKYREGLRERLGRVPSLEGRSTGNTHAERPLIWIHAVSVGEVLAVSRLVNTLEAALPDYFIAISTTTRTGQQLARERFGAGCVLYSPLDLPWAVRAYLNTLKPRLLVLAETEFWPNLLSGCFRRRIPVGVVNARISDRSWPRYRLARVFFRHLLNQISCVLAQSETDAQRLKAIGCLPQRVTAAGNLKFDVRAAHETAATKLLKTLQGNLRLVVAGSTLDGEEAALIEAWPRLLAADPELAMILAPRHPERFAAVAELLQKSGLQWVRRSSCDAASDPLSAGEILLLDSIGELASLYSLASVAFVGGSVVQAGGHNPLEPAQFGVPIVMGPHYANFRAINNDLIAEDAIRIAPKEALASTLIELLANTPAANAMGARALKVFERQAGATARCVVAIRQLLRERRP